jgi:hypothetical protein
MFELVTDLKDLAFENKYIASAYNRAVDVKLVLQRAAFLIEQRIMDGLGYKPKKKKKRKVRPSE